ncbi:hypothetical protein QYM36_016640 [Artemia franciscana]|uniref:Uncharacterized protein n=1 Tax=Artemia franciscana TaxID=6661 RepID=A0AA88L1L2_ARTSF|nr:hypothetical protein QYM36_016640 [Artemia franciscana]
MQRGFFSKPHSKILAGAIAVALMAIAISIGQYLWTAVEERFFFNYGQEYTVRVHNKCRCQIQDDFDTAHIPGKSSQDTSISTIDSSKSAYGHERGFC